MATRDMMARTIMKAIGIRLVTIALEDPALQSVTFTVHLRAGGGWPRGITTRIEAADGLESADDSETWDACGSTRRKNI